ncbi:MAG: hypothetical protein JXA00_03535 [Candidatus Thermoplasmatota archaeon]|nr:hypothetical protein [Candidatus Thermoplasmatota archaeon]
MKRKLIAVLLVIFFILNVVAAAFLFLDIQVLEFPQTTIRIDVIEITADEVIVHHDLQLYNPNSFEMILQDFEILATTPEGEEVTRMIIEGGSIPGQSNASFSADDRITMKGDLSGLLTTRISGTVGLNVFGIIRKTIPLELTVLTSLKDVVQKIAVPTIAVHANVGTITREAVELLVDIDVSNPNTIPLNINDVLLSITNEKGTSVGTFTIADAQIPAEDAITLHGLGTVLVDALNAKQLFLTLSAAAGAAIAGMNKTLPIETTIDVTIPDLTDYLPEDTFLELAIRVDLRLARGGLHGNMTLEVINPTKLPFVIKDILVDYYGVKKNQKYFVAQGPLGSGELVPENTTYFYGDILIPIVKLLNLSRRPLFPDMMFAQLRAKLTLFGLDIALPVAIGSYVDIKLLRVND